MAYVLKVGRAIPVFSSTSATLIWMDAWSLAWMILLLAELQTEIKIDGEECDKQPCDSTQQNFLPFTRDVQINVFTGVVLHVGRLLN